MSELIDSIQIQGYRCFEDTTVSGFGRVNLIGGLNNSGKTALLEALYMATQHKTNTYSGFTYALKVTLSAREKYNNSNNITDIFNKNIQINEISITLNKNEKFIFSDQFINQTFNNFGLPNWFSEESNNYSNYLPSQLGYERTTLLNSFSELEATGNHQFVIDIAKNVDPNIINLRTRHSSTDIEFEIEGIKGLIPLISLGDYIKKVLYIALRSWKSKPSYIMIDEIENGIHYTKQKSFWEFLFRLAISQNCQIFAATHSREMIEAYLSVIQENGWEQEARYFEMYRHVQTDKIMAQAKPIDILEYRLEQNLPFRGEATQS